MRFYCTYFDSQHLPHGLALHQSLLAHAGKFELTVLCLDEAAEKSLRQKALPQVQVLSLAELTGAHPALARARSDRTEREFGLTCKSWLMYHLLPKLPVGELLSYVDADVYFFSSPEPIFTEIGSAAIAITPCRYSPSLAHLNRYGKFTAGWVSLRHDPTGLKCATDWAEKCAAWCFAIPEPRRYTERKYLDAWTERFPGTVSIDNPGFHVAPWNLAEAAITLSKDGLRINGRAFVSFHFHSLRHLGRQLYDPGLHRNDLEPTDALRELVYLPYLRQLAGSAGGSDAPDIVPPTRRDDPRCGVAIPRLLEQLRSAENDRATSQLALEKNRAAAHEIIDDERAGKATTALYLKEVERERDQLRSSLIVHQEKLKKSYDDLARNVAYLKMLEVEIAAHVKIAAERDAHIANLAAERSQLSLTVTRLDPEKIRASLEPIGRHIRKFVVAKYHPHLLPQILWLSAMGVPVTA